ncbi:hypothetical protein DL766_002810 [Monosporascus sp. MC13-8B]|uniref:non-specific serine/threonine protein kinase n=1 Tax=Monosporascus cannonballus TaxID=155416 RepID=A0ABY0H0E7_9PEZI|nr:hypothetical protein DL762_007154 [Monosporascus cannonballus]RYO88175.1 hypothetical protein DL763_006080 [Monosporascus cannonballus]RYP34820.1 hypothetical protein DL766_002810 [Monosporascus sp. MC13-8B]
MTRSRQSSSDVHDIHSILTNPPVAAERHSERRPLVGKLSFPFLRKPFGVTIIHRKPSKSTLPPLPPLETCGHLTIPPCTVAGTTSPCESISISNSNTNTNSTSNATSSGKSSGKSSGQTNGTNTTAKTSVDSKLSSKHNDSGDKKSATIIRSEKPEYHVAPDTSLTTIQETALDLASPTVLTVEKAAAAKIYLELYFNELLYKPTPRSLRRRYLEAELYHNNGLTPEEKEMRRQIFYKQESDHLRETRSLKAKSAVARQGQGHKSQLADNYEIVKVIGKGSFGVVRLVREKPDTAYKTHSLGHERQVYAMKVIRKSAMLRTSQEGHLRAERDFLVASEGSRWVVPLIASFQDAANLYLVMEYMPGGDFLGLLIRENILSEPVAKFYVAEMILCIEEAHSLRCIHRDIKPDNFLISASGHLMISDFGLAFDGHWSHDTSYYYTHRYSLLHKLGITVDGDSQDRAEGLQGTAKWTQGVAVAMQRHDRRLSGWDLDEEPLLNWRNRCGVRTAARSLGIILYECLYGHTPFLSEEGGRQATKRNIVNHKQTFAFPARPVVSRRCIDLIASLIREQDSRLCSRRYRYHPASLDHSLSTGGARPGRRPRDWAGRAVYPHDAEDIKTHKWFRDLPWDRLHQLPPPFVPQISSLEDTHYFDEEDPISDWSESRSESSAASEPPPEGEAAAPEEEPVTLFGEGPGLPGGGLGARRNSNPQKAAAMQTELAAFPSHVRPMLAHFVATPYDTARLKRMDQEVERAAAHDAEACRRMKAFVRTFGRHERKRPRDRLLRDRKTRGVALEVRKQTAFMGYTYRRCRHRNGGANAAGGGGGGGFFGIGSTSAAAEWDWDGVSMDDAVAGACGGGGGDADVDGKVIDRAEMAAYRAWCSAMPGGG